MLMSVILVVHVIVAISIIVLVLLQHGKGADMGAAFGSGSAGSLFGATGASNFLSKSTGIFAAIFFVSCLALTYFQAPKGASGVMSGGVMQAPVTEQSKEGAANGIPVPASQPVPGTAKPEPKADVKTTEIPK